MNKKIVTEVKFYPIRPTEKGLIGFASCLFVGKLSLNSISVYTTLDGDIRLLFPDKTLPNSMKIGIFYPIDDDTYEIIKDAVKETIENLKEKAEKSYGQAKS